MDRSGNCGRSHAPGRPTARFDCRLPSVPTGVVKTSSGETVDGGCRFLVGRIFTLTDQPAKRDGPVVLLQDGQEVLPDGARAAVIQDEQHRALGDLRIGFQEIRQFLGSDGFKALVVDIAHQLLEIISGDLVGQGHRPLGDRVEHDRHDDRAGFALVGVPAVLEIGAGVGDVGVGCVFRT